MKKEKIMHKNSKSNINDGFMELNEELNDLMKWADKDRIRGAQIAGASYLVDKVRKLSKPKRTGKLLKSIDYENDGIESSTDVGWKVYYGRIVENGHRVGSRPSRSKKKKVKDTRPYIPAQPHLYPTFKNNKEKIYEIMIKEIRKED